VVSVVLGFHAKTARSQTDTPGSDFAFFFDDPTPPGRNSRKWGNRRGSVGAELAKKKRTDARNFFVFDRYSWLCDLRCFSYFFYQPRADKPVKLKFKENAPEPGRARWYFPFACAQSSFPPWGGKRKRIKVGTDSRPAEIASKVGTDSQPAEIALKKREPTPPRVIPVVGFQEPTGRLLSVLAWNPSKCDYEVTVCE
jgi:hypothetical protein